MLMMSKFLTTGDRFDSISLYSFLVHEKKSVAVIAIPHVREKQSGDIKNADYFVILFRSIGTGSRNDTFLFFLSWSWRVIFFVQLVIFCKIRHFPFGSPFFRQDEHDMRPYILSNFSI